MELAAGTAPSRNSLGRTTSASASRPVVKNPPAPSSQKSSSSWLGRRQRPGRASGPVRSTRPGGRRPRPARRSRPPRRRCRARPALPAAHQPAVVRASRSTGTRRSPRPAARSRALPGGRGRLGQGGRRHGVPLGQHLVVAGRLGAPARAAGQQPARLFDRRPGAPAGHRRARTGIDLPSQFPLRVMPYQSAAGADQLRPEGAASSSLGVKVAWPPSTPSASASTEEESAPGRDRGSREDAVQGLGDDPQVVAVARRPARRAGRPGPAGPGRSASSRSGGPASGGRWQ